MKSEKELCKRYDSFSGCNQMQAHFVYWLAMRQIRQPYIIRLAATLISVTLIVFALYHSKVVVVPLLFATIFAVMLFPFCLRLEKWGFPKGMAAFTSVFIATIILGFLAYILFTQ